MGQRYEFDGELLREHMRNAGFDDAGLAVELGCSKSLVTMYGLSYRQPPPSRLVTIAALLNVHVEDLFTVADEVITA